MAVVKSLVDFTICFSLIILYVGDTLSSTSYSQTNNIWSTGHPESLRGPGAHKRNGGLGHTKEMGAFHSNTYCVHVAT